MRLPEQALVTALSAGDERAFNEIVGRYHHAIVRVARSHVRTDAIAEEVAQDTWAALVTGIDRFQGRSSIKTWLFSIAVNKARTRSEREARTLPFSSLAFEDEDGGALTVEDRFGPDERWSSPPRPWEDPERRLGSLEAREELRVALAELPQRQRLVVTLRDVEGLSSEEVCDMLELSPGNERVLLHRGRTRLRAALEAAGLLHGFSPASSGALA